MFSELNVATKRKIEFIDISSKIEGLIKKAKIKEGICHIFVPHTTAGITINENADPSVIRDLVTNLERIVPNHGDYTHMEGNSPAHIKSSLVGHATSVFIKNEGLALGTWQGIFFCEFDGPRQRKAWVQIRG